MSNLSTFTKDKS